MTWEGNPSYEEVEMEYGNDSLSLKSFLVKNRQLLEEFSKEWEREHPLIITRPECEAQYKSWSTWCSRFVDFVKHRSKNNAS